MIKPSGDLLILGLGNVLMRDEGIGVHVARFLADSMEEDEELLPPGTQAVDGGTLGIELLPLIDEARAVVFVDAVDFGLRPGHIAALRGSELEQSFGTHLSAHQVGAADLVALSRLVGMPPDRIALVGVQPGAVEVGLELTDEVRAAVPVAASLVRRQAWAVAREEGRCTKRE